MEKTDSFFLLYFILFKNFFAHTMKKIPSIAFKILQTEFDETHLEL